MDELTPKEQALIAAEREACLAAVRAVLAWISASKEPGWQAQVDALGEALNAIAERGQPSS